MRRECLDMKREVCGHDVNLPGFATTSYNIGSMLLKMENVEEGVSIVQNGLHLAECIRCKITAFVYRASRELGPGSPKRWFTGSRFSR